MGLDSFKTDGPRTFKKDKSALLKEKDVLHVPKGVDPDDLDVPSDVIMHTVEYHTLIEPSEDEEGHALCICNKCTKVSSSYKGIIKSDYFKHRDEDWAEEYKNSFINYPVDEPDLTPISDTDDSSTDDSGGLESFMS